MIRPLGLVALLATGCGLMVAPRQLDQLSPDAFHQALQDDTGAFLVDVHVPEQEHLAGTDAFIPYREVNDQLERFPQDLHEPIYL